MEKSYPHVKRHINLTLNLWGKLLISNHIFHIYIMAPIPIGYGPNPLRVDPIFLHRPRGGGQQGSGGGVDPINVRRGILVFSSSSLTKMGHFLFMCQNEIFIVH